MAPFDTYVMVDWSASSKPKLGRDSIWVGWGQADRVSTENLPTRAAARAWVRDFLVAEVGRRRRVLVGFDFPYGYPQGFGAALGKRSDSEWRRVWEELSERLVDDSHNRNTRFAVSSDLNELVGREPGPFWMRPASAGTPALGLRRPSFPYPSSGGELAEWRETEQKLLRTGRRPQSAWKLFGAGSVGSQTLVGIPVVHALRTDPALAAVSGVWPFETGFTRTPAPEHGPFVLHAEIWPGVVEVAPLPDEVRDSAQVRTLVAELALRDRVSSLGALFAPAGASAAAARAEGWILGS